MNTVYKGVLMVAFCLLFASAAFSAQLEGFNYANDTEAQAAWIISGNDTGNGGSATVYAESTIKQEGISSVKFVYNYSGNQYYEMMMTKTLSTPLDLSQAKQFKMWMYGDSATGDGLIWYIRFYSSNGHVYRYVDWSGTGETGWREITFDPLAMETEYWMHGPWGGWMDNPVINKIEKIEIIVQQTGDVVSGGGTATLYFDDLRTETVNDDVSINLIDGFNYATDGELEAVWSVTIPSPPPDGFALDISTTETCVEGDYAMQMDYTIVDYWRNIVCLKVFDTVQDFSDVSFFRIWIHGDSSIADKSPVMLFTIEDEDMNRAWAHMRSGLLVSDWNCYFLDFVIGPMDGSGGSGGAPFWQDKFDAGTTLEDIDESRIKKIGLFTQGSVQYEEYSFICVVDAMEYGEPYVAPPIKAGESWLMYE